jgi:hypothetical protein
MVTAVAAAVDDIGEEYKDLGGGEGAGGDAELYLFVIWVV